MVDNPGTNPLITVQLNGRIAGDLVGYAEDKIRVALRRTSIPVLRTAIVVTRHPDPARNRPVTAHVNVDLNGRPVRMYTDAGSPREAVDMLADGLRSRIERLGSGWRFRRGHGDRAPAHIGSAGPIPVKCPTEEV